MPWAKRKTKPLPPLGSLTYREAQEKLDTMFQGPPSQARDEYAERAEKAYLQALALATPRAPAEAPAGGQRRLRNAIGSVVNERRSNWDRAFAKVSSTNSQGGEAANAQRWAELRKRFHTYTLEALYEEKRRKAEQTAQPQVPVPPRSPQRGRSRVRVSTRHGKRQTKKEGTLRAQLATPSAGAQRARVSPAWGGVGWRYSMADGENAKLRQGWQQQVVDMATVFDQRHESYSRSAQKLLREQGHKLSDSAKQRQAMDKALFGLRSNRWTQQPLRLNTNIVSPRSHIAKEEYGKPLALPSSRGGPLVPVYEKPFDTEIYAEDEPEPEPEVEWTLFGSIWGPRCDGCDGRDFVDHEEVVFERFAADWQAMLRLGVAKYIIKNDDGGSADDDGDGVPDEVEDVGAVLFLNHPLITYAWLMFADAVYGNGSDISIGIKLNQGWKAFTEECKIWSHLSEKDAACANSLIFMDVDRVDHATSAAVAIQAKFRGSSVRRRIVGQTGLSTEVMADATSAEGAELEPVELKKASRAALDLVGDSAMDIAKKADNQLNRVEFGCALIKTAIERFVKTKQVADVSEAVDKLFDEHIQPALEVPRAHRQQPRMPLPDAFRLAVCYTPEMTRALDANAPSLRVIFAGLAKATFEAARAVGTKLPKPADNKLVQRAPGVKWLRVPGCVSYRFWWKFVDALFPNLEQRKLTLCFLYSVMAVIDGHSDEGRIKEQHLQFESFLEAIVRLATRLPLPTDAQLAAAELSHAGPFLAALEASDPSGTLKRMTAEQVCEWGAAPDAAVADAMPRRVSHLIDVIVRKIRQGKNAEADSALTTLTRREFRHWAAEHVQGAQGSVLPEKWAEVRAVGESPPEVRAVGQ